MSENLFVSLQSIFSWGWSFFTSFKIPGTEFTPAVMFLFIPVIVLGVRFIKATLHFDWYTSKADVSHIQQRYAQLRDKYD